MEEVKDGREMTVKELTQSSIYDFSVQNIDQISIPLSNYKPQVSLIINVASQWSLSLKNYAQLTQLHMRHAKRGLSILLFPCNQFGNEEPRSDAEIKKLHLHEGWSQWY